MWCCFQQWASMVAKKRVRVKRVNTSLNFCVEFEKLHTKYEKVLRFLEETQVSRETVGNKQEKHWQKQFWWVWNHKVHVEILLN